ncbi:MAG: carbohydrate ABC transporter permease [Oscillospiraceae bacterium]|nr:carbohydrate ABC transporter permease [Oscillospiraceae bacterium]
MISSFVTPKEYILNPAMVIPKRIVLDNYYVIFTNRMIFTGYKNTLILVVFGVTYSLLLTVCMGYAFSRKSFPGKKLFFSLVLFTMFFGGGLIPQYLLMRSLNLIGKLHGVILLGGVSVFYMIIIKNSFEQIPESLEESAKIDGANDVVIFSRIMLPLQLPMLATITLFFTVDRWNSWFAPMLYLNDNKLWPLQVVLRSIVNNIRTLDTEAVSQLGIELFPIGIKMAAIVVTMLPIMMLYPFLQRYFVKGILVGAIKM